MFEVLLGDKTLYYPANEEFTIYDTELTQDVGQAGEFTFKVPPTNPLYSQITSGALITILKDKKEYWRGEIKNLTVDFARVIEVYCVEDLIWLADDYVTPYSSTSFTYKQWLDMVIDTYNQAGRPSERQFGSGSVYGGSSLCNWVSEYGWTILEAIRKLICRDDLYVKVRRTYENGRIRRYIDVKRLQDYGKTTNQPIEFGYNLLDYVKDSDYENLTNVVVGYGEELEDQEVYPNYSRRLVSNTYSNEASINKYGRHAKAVIFDGVTDLTTLNRLTSAYVSRYCQPQLTIEVKAVDLSAVENVQDIEIGDQVRIVAKPYEVDQYLYLTQIKRDLQDIGNNTLTLSGTVARKTLTSQVIAARDEVEEIPTEWNILKAAKRNALAMLLDETQGGYVVFEYDSTNTKMIAINVCNSQTIEASTMRWRWSQNGLGYMERGNIGQAWSTLKVAMTQDGSIVADRVNTGILTAAIIKAGILSDVNGQFSLNMTTGALTMNSGTFRGQLDAATGSFSGWIKATSGYIGSEANGWNIKTSYINTKDGPTTVSQTSKSGTYIGKSGILNSNGSGKYVQIKDGEITANAGHIGGAEIKSDRLQYTSNSKFSKAQIGCGEAGRGIVNLVGDTGNNDFGYIQISNSGDPTTCLNGIRIYGNGRVVRYNGSGTQIWEKFLSNIPEG